MATWTDGGYCGTYYMKSSYYCGRNVDRTVKACNTPKTCWHWPTDGSLVRCTDNDKVYKYIDREKKLYLLDNQNFTNENNIFWGSNEGKSNCNDSNWGRNNTAANRKPFNSVTTAAEGRSVRCFEKKSDTVYRWTNGELKTYPNAIVAASWDAKWVNASTFKCDSHNSTGVMASKLPDGTILKCSDDTSKYYRYHSARNQVIYYPEINNNILKQYNNYQGTQWDNPAPTTQDCSQYNLNRPNLKDSLQPLVNTTTDGTPLKCYNQDTNSKYRYSSVNDSLIQYPNQETANTWDSNAWNNFKLYDCSRIWNNNSGAKANMAPCKPSDGTIVKCSDDNKYYRYASGANSLLLYETPAIARQYSKFQLLQRDPKSIQTASSMFENMPSYAWQFASNPKKAAYTFSFECCIQRGSTSTRNILSNAGNHTATANAGNHRPAIFITGTDVPSVQSNRIQIMHATTDNPNMNIVSNFTFTPEVWFTVTFIVNNGTMFTYFNGNKDKSVTTSSGVFDWGNGSVNGWIWNSYGGNEAGYVQVRNVRFWPFPMALESPERFDPIEMIDVINPYTNVKTGEQIAVTTLPPALNCKAFVRPGITFFPNEQISAATVKNGDSLKCKGIDDKIYRYNQQRDKLFEYTADGKYTLEQVAKSWDPNYSNYKAYNCQPDYTNGAGKLQLKPPNNSVVKCTDNASSYRYVNASNKLELYLNDTIIKQYNPDWLITQRLSKNCEQYDPARSIFEPTQNVSSATRSLHDGTALKCNNDVSRLYRYNSQYDILMEYPNSIIAKSWDPLSVDDYYSYTCDNTYLSNKGTMQEKPKQSTIIKCSNNEEKDNGFYYIYNFSSNTLKPKPSIDSIKTMFPKWNSNNIQYNDCRQYFPYKPRFYDDSNGKGNVTKLIPQNYDGCIPLPYTPTDTQNRSLVRDEEQILLYTDPSCNNIYSNLDGDKNKAVNITYTSTNIYNDPLIESNPTHYKIVSDDVFNTHYNLNQAASLPTPPELKVVSGLVTMANGTPGAGSSGGSNRKGNLISEAEYYAKYGLAQVNMNNINTGLDYASMGVNMGQNYLNMGISMVNQNNVNNVVNKVGSSISNILKKIKI
jgi:hypothetical protein